MSVQTLPVEVHVRAVAEAARQLRDRARQAGLEAPVPTCPRWRVADLLAHQGMVHRWATGHVRGDTSPQPSKGQVLATVPREELLGWFDEGALALVRTLADAPADLEAMVFLHDAPAPRQFWARRQAHETTVHSVDALAALLGRAPTAAEADVAAEVALDGIDELLRGFVTRGRSPMCDHGPCTIEVAPEDSPRRWRLEVGTDSLVTHRAVEGEQRTGGPADAVLHGSAAQLYLGLWNRGTEITATGRTELLAAWRTAHRIRWS